jgi:hypothetical protein
MEQRTRKQEQKYGQALGYGLGRRMRPSTCLRTPDRDG